MSSRMIYGVFPNNQDTWGLTPNLKKARRFLKKNGGGIIRALARAYGCTSFDAPTFCAVADVIETIPSK